MSFPRVVKDKVVQYPRRYQLVLVSGNTYDLIPVPGTITEAGTAINKAYLQPIEDALAANASAITTNTNNIATNAANIAENTSDITNNISQLLLGQDIKGTTQFPTFVNGVPTKIEHKNAVNAIVRTDTFTFTDALITETRTLSAGGSITFKHYFTGGVYQKTEVQ